MTKEKKSDIINCFAKARHFQQEESKMAVNYARLKFAHRLVTNFYSSGLNHTARTFLERLGGEHYLKELEETLQDEDIEAKNQLANLSFVWWRVTGNIEAHDRALAIWSILSGSDELGIHAISMIAYITLMDQTTPATQIRERIVQLRIARKQNTDVEHANRLAVLASKLGELFFKRCNKDN